MNSWMNATITGNYSTTNSSLELPKIPVPSAKSIIRFVFLSANRNSMERNIQANACIRSKFQDGPQRCVCVRLQSNEFTCSYSHSCAFISSNISGLSLFLSLSQFSTMIKKYISITPRAFPSKPFGNIAKWQHMGACTSGYTCPAYFFATPHDAQRNRLCATTVGHFGNFQKKPNGSLVLFFFHTMHHAHSNTDTCFISTFPNGSIIWMEHAYLLHVALALQRHTTPPIARRYAFLYVDVDDTALDAHDSDW